MWPCAGRPTQTCAAWMYNFSLPKNIALRGSGGALQRVVSLYDGSCYASRKRQAFRAAAAPSEMAVATWR